MSKKKKRLKPAPSPAAAADRPVRPGSTLYRLLEMVAQAVAADPGTRPGDDRPPKPRGGK